MPGCNGPLANRSATSDMTGSIELGPIRSQQDSMPLLDERLFIDDQPKSLLLRLPPATPSARRRMITTIHSNVQLTPLWEYVVRTKKFPKDVNVEAVFYEISERLRDPEWEVRQHALRVLVDVLPTFSTENIDRVANIVLSDLIENLGNTAPAVRKGSLDALRIYLLHSAKRDEIARRILHDGMNLADVLDDYQTNVTTGVILATPLLLFPSRSGAPASNSLIREATQALAMRLVQVTHQESALRSLAKIRDTVGDDEFGQYLTEIDDSMRRNFELLCEVYGIKKNFSAKRRRPRSKAASGTKSQRRRDSIEDSIKEVVAVDNSWDSEDSDTSGIAEEDEDNVRVSSSASVSSRRVVLETEIKFDEETAITMTILEEQNNKDEEKVEIKEIDRNDKNELVENEATADVNTTEEEASPEERRKTPKRVHFGGEIVKLRTPDSEDAESVMSIDVHRHAQLPSPLISQHKLPSVTLPRTRIPLPVSPATRMPQRPRSSSQPIVIPPSRQLQRLRLQRRSASSSPKRELHTHRPDLSPKKSILAKSSENDSTDDRKSDSQVAVHKPHVSRRDSITSPRIIIEEIDDDNKPKEPSFQIGEESSISSSPRLDVSLSPDVRSRSSSPELFGGVFVANEEKTIESVFGDKTSTNFQEKFRKDHENMMQTVYRSRSAPQHFDWDDKEGRDRRRYQSAKSPGYEVFPRQERNYILMELASPVKDRSRRASLEDSISPSERSKNDSISTEGMDDLNKDSIEDDTMKSVNVNEEKRTEEQTVDSNKLEESEKKKVEGEKSRIDLNKEEDAQLGIFDEDVEKSVFDTKERSSDSSSDGEWKNKELSWEELGLVDDEVLEDFHNKDDWVARVRGLERIASALRTPSALTTLEPRLGSLLLAVLGVERSCRIAAAGLAVAKVVLAGVSEEALKNRLPLIAWGLARQGGPNAAQLARLTMLRVGAGLFLEKLLQPQCVDARNAKTRENTLQLLIFSLVTFPSTEFKVKFAIDKVLAMVGDRRKRVRHSALDTLAILSQIYESEDILEASKRFTKGKLNSQTMHAAIKTRLSRKLLPTVSTDGLVVYGLQISSNSQCTGADVEWIIAGSGSFSPGTGRTRSQLTVMSKTDDESNDHDYVIKKAKVRPSSEYSMPSGISSGLLEKDERISSWKLLPQSDHNHKPRKKIDRTSKSADVSKVNNLIFENQIEELLEKESKIQKLYATQNRKFESQILNNQHLSAKQLEESIRGSSSAPAPKQESRIPVYTGSKVLSSESNNESFERSLSEDATRIDTNGYLSMHQKRKLNVVKSAVPRSNYTINYAYPNKYLSQQFERPCEDLNADLEKKFKDDCKNSALRNVRENQRVFSYEKLNKGFDAVVNNLRSSKSTPDHHQYVSKTTETYETIYQRQRRLKENRESRPYTSTTGLPFYGYPYEGYIPNTKFQADGIKNIKKGQSNASTQKRNVFSTPFDDPPLDQSTETDKDNTDRATSGNPNRKLNGGSKTTSTIPDGDQASSPRHDGGEARSSSGSSSSSNRSVLSVRRVRSRQTLPSHTESDESNRHDQVDRTNVDKAFNVIGGKGHLNRRDNSDVLSMRATIDKEVDQVSFDSEDEPPLESALRRRRSSSANSSSDRSSDRPNKSFGRSRSALSIDKIPPIERQLSSKHSLESLLRGTNNDKSKTAHEDIRLPPLQCNGYGDQMPSVKSSPVSRSSSDRTFSARCSSRSITELNDFNDHNEIKETSESPEDAAFETLDFRNGASKETVGTISIAITSPPLSRPVYDCDNDLHNTNSNNTLYSCNNMSPKCASPKRFVSELPPVNIKDTDSDETSPVPIGFDNDRHRLDESCSDEGSYESHDELAVSNKLQASRLPTPVDLPKRLCKMSLCRMRPQANCHRATLLPLNRHDKHPEKSSKMIQQCLANLDSSAWEITLKGLRTLSQLAKDDPEQLDTCAPGLLLRMLGKHVKNLRSQVARVACSTASDVFSAHIRGIDQDLDEVAGPLLHRTADTNRFLREDCNVALDSMIEHFPPHRTIMTIANRGASHQNTIVHATTARLVYSIVSEIGPECTMVLPRDVKDKLFSTTAKLLTDGNLQARKYAKETFRLLLSCEGFRKALTDAVPENTLRLIEKTLRSL